MHRHCLLRMCSPMENNDALTGHLISPGPWPWSQRGLGEWVYRCVDQFLHSQHQCWEAHRKWAGCCFCVGSTGYFPYVISTRCSATLEKGLSSSHPRANSPNREMMEQPRHPGPRRGPVLLPSGEHCCDVALACPLPSHHWLPVAIQMQS